MTMVQEFQKKKKKIEEKSRVLESAIKLPDARDDIIDLFRKRTFPYKGNVFKTKEKESEEESEGNKLEKIKNDYKKIVKYIEDESNGIDYDLFEDYFSFSIPSALVKKNYIRQKIKRKTMS